MVMVSDDQRCLKSKSSLRSLMLITSGNSTFGNSFVCTLCVVPTSKAYDKRESS